jgi:adenylate cyclase
MAALKERLRSLTPSPELAQALDREIMASEKLRVRVLAAALAIFLGIFVVMMVFFGDIILRISGGSFSIWYPISMVAPFLAYEILVSFALGRLEARGRMLIRPIRFANAFIETSLPTVIMVVSSSMIGSSAGFGLWPSLYGVYIVASVLRLEFALPLFTGTVAAVEYFVAAAWTLPLSMSTEDALLAPPYHGAKSVLLVLAGVVAGLVALRLRRALLSVLEESARRERVTNLFGQHVSPAVVERLLDRPVDAAGEMRDICVLFLDIRNFTAYSRARPPAEVVAYLNELFAFMIEAVDRHHGIINKFLGDGFIAVFGAPLDDPLATRHAVASAREILAEIDRRGLDKAPWPLRVGIGIHTGAAVTGNVGSPRRKEFTVIGDVVNLAARLEQATKEFGSRLLVSDAVAAKLGTELGSSTAIGPVNVKGYDSPVPVWQLDPAAPEAGKPALVSP